MTPDITSCLAILSFQLNSLVPRISVQSSGLDPEVLPMGIRDAASGTGTCISFVEPSVPEHQDSVVTELCPWLNFA